VVAVGVALEGPELLHEMWPRLFTCFTRGSVQRIRKFKRIIKKVGLWGWLLVVVGIVGEGIFEALQNRAEGQLQTFNDILLADAQRNAGNARASAIDAANAAQKAIDSERELQAMATTLRKQIEAAHKKQVWLGERSIIIIGKQKEFEQHLTQFKGQRVIFTVCGGQFWFRGDQEIMETAQSLASALQRAEWKMESVPVRNTSPPGTLFVVIDDLCGTIGYGASIFFRNDAPERTRDAAKSLQAVIDDVLLQYGLASEMPPNLLVLKNQSDVHMLGSDVLKVEVRMHPMSPSGPSLDDKKLLKHKP
jgi:hypothetical protein